MKNHFLNAALGLGATAVAAQAAHIAVNFSENSANQNWTSGASLIGPLNTQAQYFNSSNNPTGGPANTHGGTLAAGTLGALVDDSGASVATTVSWTASTVWWNSDGTGTDQQRLAVGYLDDGATSGGFGAQITVANVPYAQYQVLGLLASDASDTGNPYTTLDFNVNGSPVLGGTATAYGNIALSQSNTGSPWSPLTLSTPGNYWTSAVQTSSTLTITGAVGPVSGARGSISGFIIQQVPEPTTAALSMLAFAGGVVFRRRRN